MMHVGLWGVRNARVVSGLGSMLHVRSRFCSTARYISNNTFKR